MTPQCVNIQMNAIEHYFRAAMYYFCFYLNFGPPAFERMLKYINFDTFLVFLAEYISFTAVDYSSFVQYSGTLILSSAIS